jgi:GAF domain-containing protein
MMRLDLTALSAALGEPGQTRSFFAVLDRALQQSVGHIYMTLLVVDGDEVVRVYSSDEANYPVSGRKPMGSTPWGAHVIKGKQPFLATDRAGLRWAFFDHALMESMGVGSAINVPVVHDGKCIGTINLNHAEHHYGREHLAAVAPVAPLLIPAFLELVAAKE